MMYSVAFVGKVNVGKSSLFNSLCRKQKALVSSIPGVTRDILKTTLRLKNGEEVRLIDTAGFRPSLQENELFPNSLPTEKNLIRERAKLEANVASKLDHDIKSIDILMVTFDISDITAQDHILLRKLRKLGKPMIPVFNKADSVFDEAMVSNEVKSLGIEYPIFTSALRGFGLSLLLDKLQEVSERIKEKKSPPKISDETEDGAGSMQEAEAVCLIGRPNAGKSSLFNALCKEQIALVSKIPGTTRDALESIIKVPNFSAFNRGSSHAALPLKLIDTAGLRRRAATLHSVKKRSTLLREDAEIEILSVKRALMALRHSMVSLLLIDASEGIRDQDKKIMQRAVDERSSLIVVFSKFDLVDIRWKEYLKEKQFGLPLLEKFLTLKISTRKNTGIKALLKAVSKALVLRQSEISTVELNKALKLALETHAPPVLVRQAHRKVFQVYYGVQIRKNPPLIKLFVNKKLKNSHIYNTYLTRFLKKYFDLNQVPLRLIFEEKQK